MVFSWNYGLSQSCVLKTSVKMTRVALIVKREGFWRFSTKFMNAFKKFFCDIEAYQTRAGRGTNGRDKIFIEMAERSRA